MTELTETGISLYGINPPTSSPFLETKFRAVVAPCSLSLSCLTRMFVSKRRLKSYLTSATTTSLFGTSYLTS